MKKTLSFFAFLGLILIIFSSSLVMADQNSELMVYTSRSEHLIKNIFEKYEKQTGIKVSYRTGDPGQLIQTLLSEGEKTTADIFMTVDAGNLWFASEQNLLSGLESETLNNNIPAHLRDQDNQWYGLSVRARTIVYNDEKVNEKELTSYENLADEKWKNRICLRTSRKVYNQSLVAMLIHELGQEKARKVLQGWINNTVEIFSNDTSVLRAIASGQCDIGIVNTYYYGRLMAQNPELPLKIFWPNQQDSYGVHVNVSGAGILKHSKNSKMAQDFLEWLSSKKAQTEFAQVNLEYSANPNVEQTKAVQSWGEFKQNNTFNLSMAGKLQRQAIRLMHEVGYN